MLFKKKILKKIFKNLFFISKKFNFQIYIIGGYVRNLLLNKSTKDIDIVTTGDSIKLAKIFFKLIKAKQIFFFKRYKTAIVKYKKYQIEFVSTRKEFYNIYNNKPYIKLLKNIKEDQKRRDFTINTIAINLSYKKIGEIIDPFNGINDIKNKIIKTPIDPDKIFFDDPLRMLRAIRFHTIFNFKIDKKIIYSILNNINRIRIIAIERIILEFNKILMANKPSQGLILMDKLGFLSIILPEFVELKKKINNTKNCFKHTLKVLDKICKFNKNLWFRWATLLHDIGKPISKKFYKNKGWTFYNHEIIGSNMIPYIFYKLKLPIKKNLKYIQTIIKYSNMPIILINKNIKIKTIRKFINKVGIKIIKDIILLSLYDITTKFKKKKYKQQKKIIKLYNTIIKIENEDKIYNIKLSINGHDIINYFKIKPSKIVGIIKNKIKYKIIKGELKNKLNDIFKYMKKIGYKIIKKYNYEY
ncbi:MAG: HD domain-containing protein [Candidatus Shikimatogenerans bostrichidophilus]|nr:MAG: HD domain-containing protein [Candidatus Shikimatogenerans bostrichidophilus]